MKGKYQNNDLSNWITGNGVRRGEWKVKLRFGCFWICTVRSGGSSDEWHRVYHLIIGPGEVRGFTCYRLSKRLCTVRLLFNTDGLSDLLEAIVLEGNYEKS